MPLEPIQLDDRTFEQIVAEVKARIPVHTQEWTNFNESDPGITLVQLFAFMTENLLYRSNRIPEANRRKFLTLLNIGLQPASPGRGLITFQNDRGPLTNLPLAQGVEVRAGKVPFRTRTPVNILPITAVAFYKEPHTNLDDAAKKQYTMLFQTFLDSSADQLVFYQTKQLELPENGKALPVVDLSDSLKGPIDRALWIALVGRPNESVDDVRRVLAGQTLSLGIYPALQSDESVLSPATSEDNKPIKDPGLVFEIAAPTPDPRNPRVGIGPARYQRLLPDYTENVLEAPGIVNLTLPSYNKLLLWELDIDEGTGDFPPLVEDVDLAKRIVTWLRISLPRPIQMQSPAFGPSTSSQNQGITALKLVTRSQAQTQITWAGINAARVVQAVPVVQELLAIGTGAPDQVYKVANTPVLADETLQTTPDNAPINTFFLEVQDANGNWQVWQRIDDLSAALPSDMVYLLDPESGQVSFGSGLHGFRPPLGRKIRVTYEYGGGPDGQVAIGAINKGITLPGGFKVTNPLPTWGADAGESVTDGERNITRYLRHRDRLVTVNDFRDITLRTPGVNVARVEVLPLFNPDMFDPTSDASTQTWPGTITVLVIPKSDQTNLDAPPPTPDRLFLEAVATWLNPHRLVTTEIYVRGPVYVPIAVSVGIVTMAGQLREVVQRNVLAAIRDYLSPLTGGVPTVSDITLETDPSQTSSQGWPLSTDVRVQDLEAIATRVPGVRYIDSIKLAQLPTRPDDILLTDVMRVPLSGLQLPQLVSISVREGSAEDLDAVLGQQLPSALVNPGLNGQGQQSPNGTPNNNPVPGQTGPGQGLPTGTPFNTVPVPLIPKKC